ncbi:MAG: DUF5302 domain-containing protein [Actinomycetota bacterium]|nr:DUF5302 domain-containing protein [Actinomycetota bacterium]
MPASGYALDDGGAWMSGWGIYWLGELMAEKPQDNEDLKKKMREALDRKKANDTGVDQQGHEKEKAPETHGPLGGVQMHRRKAGGGGA